MQRQAIGVEMVARRVQVEPFISASDAHLQAGLLCQFREAFGQCSTLQLLAFGGTGAVEQCFGEAGWQTGFAVDNTLDQGARTLFDFAVALAEEGFPFVGGKRCQVAAH
ncbi:hypothetical protein D9M72_624260 [compost metagenome]